MHVASNSTQVTWTFLHPNPPHPFTQVTWTILHPTPSHPTPTLHARYMSVITPHPTPPLPLSGNPRPQGYIYMCVCVCTYTLYIYIQTYHTKIDGTIWKSFGLDPYMVCFPSFSLDFVIRISPGDGGLGASALSAERPTHRHRWWAASCPGSPSRCRSSEDGGKVSMKSPKSQKLMHKKKICFF